MFFFCPSYLRDERALEDVPSSFFDLRFGPYPRPSRVADVVSAGDQFVRSVCAHTLVLRMPQITVGLNGSTKGADKSKKEAVLLFVYMVGDRKLLPI